jgi:peptide-methionine (S)-S-oxide reductase
MILGYAGGDVEEPSWAEVLSDTTGHALVVQVEFNPSAVSYEVLLDNFWRGHDPTTINQQGADIGSFYRSIILCCDEGQFRSALGSRDRLQQTGKFRRAIVTQISAAADFWRAEARFHP